MSHGEVEDMFADLAGELLDWPVIAVRDHRSNIHRDIPFHFDVKGELLPRVWLLNQKRLMPLFYNFWTSLASNLYFRTDYDAKGIESHAFGVIEASVKAGFCGQTLPPAADKLCEKSHLV